MDGDKTDTFCICQNYYQKVTTREFLHLEIGYVNFIVLWTLLEHLTPPSDGIIFAILVIAGKFEYSKNFLVWGNKNILYF